MPTIIVRGFALLLLVSATIGLTAQNPVGIQPRNIGFSDPPTSGELNEVQSKIN